VSRRSTLSTKPKPAQAAACGMEAGSRSVSRHKNPFRRSDPRWHQWVAGWRIGVRWPR
jgi:ribosome modulation factor